MRSLLVYAVTPWWRQLWPSQGVFIRGWAEGNVNSSTSHLISFWHPLFLYSELKWTHTNPANLRLNSLFLLPVFDFKIMRLWGNLGACFSLFNWISMCALLPHCTVSRLQWRLLSPVIPFFSPFVSPALFSALCCSPSLYVIIRQLRTRTSYTTWPFFYFDLLILYPSPVENFFPVYKEGKK